MKRTAYQSQKKTNALIELRPLMQTNIKKGLSIEMGRKDLELGDSLRLKRATV